MIKIRLPNDLVISKLPKLTKCFHHHTADPFFITPFHHHHHIILEFLSKNLNLDQRPSNERPRSNYFTVHLRFLTFILSLFGFGYHKSENKCFVHLYRFYTIFILCCSFVFPLRCAMTLDWNQSIATPQMCLQVTVLVWGVQAFLACLSAVYVINRGHVNRLVEMWDRFDLDEMIKHSGVGVKRRVKSIVCHLVGLGYLIMHVSSSIILFSFTNPNLFSDNLFGSPSLKYLGVAILILDQIVWVSHKLYFTSICFCMISAWKSLGESLDKHRCLYSFPDMIEWTLTKHDQLSDLIESASDSFAFYTLSQIAISVPTLVMEMYIFALFLSDGKYPLLLKFQLGMWAMNGIIQLIAICYAAGITGEASGVATKFFKRYVEHTCKGARRQSDIPPPSLLEFKQENSLQNQNQELIILQKATALLSRLQSDEVAMTMCDLASLNKAFLLTMVGVIFNYFFLLLQFAQPPPAGPVPQQSFANNTCHS